MFCDSSSSTSQKELYVSSFGGRDKQLSLRFSLKGTNPIHDIRISAPNYPIKTQPFHIVTLGIKFQPNIEGIPVCRPSAKNKVKPEELHCLKITKYGVRLSSNV